MIITSSSIVKFIQTTTLRRYIEQVGKWKEVGSEKLTCIDACKRQENKIFVSESLFPSRVRQVDRFLSI